MEIDDQDIPLESLGSRFKLSDSLEMHNLSTDYLSVSLGSQASLVSPSGTADDNGLPVLAEEDEDISSTKDDSTGSQEGGETEQNQSDERQEQGKNALSIPILKVEKPQIKKSDN